VQAEVERLGEEHRLDGATEDAEARSSREDLQCMHYAPGLINNILLLQYIAI
jgi:hypothetical protein